MTKEKVHKIKREQKSYKSDSQSTKKNKSK